MKSENSISSTTRNCFGCKYSKYNHNAGTEECHLCMWENQYTPTTKNDLEVREFEGIEVTYPPEDICIYPEYKGKPYFGIKYKENGEEIVGYGTYNPEVLSRYLKNYFISTTRNLPSLSPQEPRKGHWIPYLKEGLIVKCSECGSRFSLGYNYCPHCGADMRASEE